MALPKFEEFKAPWETDAGDVEIDKARLKKYIYNVLSDKENANTKVTEVTTERDKLQAAVDEVARKDETETQRLQRENKELADKLAAKPVGESTETLKLRVALKLGLSETQAKRLVGSTQEELEADAEDLLKSFGSEGTAPEGEDEAPVRRTVRRHSNPADPDPDAPSEIDVDKAMNDIPRL